MYMNTDVPSIRNICVWPVRSMERVKMCVTIVSFEFVLEFTEWACHFLLLLLQGGAIFERRSFVCDVTNSCGGPLEEAMSR